MEFAQLKKEERERSQHTFSDWTNETLWIPLVSYVKKPHGVDERKSGKVTRYNMNM